MIITQENTSVRRKSFWSQWRAGQALVTGALALVLVGLFATPARAHGHVFVGGIFGLPVPVYPYVSTYRYVPAHPYAVYGGYAVVAPPAVPPRAWARGHWAWRRGPWHQRARVWVPTHLR